MKELKGIDISEWQTGLDYATMAKHLDFVIIREGYRQAQDKMFTAHVNGFRAAHIPIKGVYHFIYALNNQQARQEAESCIRNVQAAGLPKTTWIFADFEYDTINNAIKHGVRLGPNECRMFTETFCQTIKAAGYPTGISTHLDYAKSMYGDEILSRWPVWFAQYSNTKSRNCMVWQYSNKGTVTGFWERLDMDIWYEDDQVATPIPREKTIDELAKEVLDGKWGNGDARKAALGEKYDAVQKRVNEILKGNSSSSSIEELARDVLAGKYGSGDERRKKLGSKYAVVQAKVNEILGIPNASPVNNISDKRTAYISQLQSWVGKNERDGSFRSIIDTYNSGLSSAVKKWGTRNVRMQYDWAWCACTVSAAAIAAGVADIIPIEISCPYMINIAQKFGIWVENDGYVPKTGDIIMYDWQDSGYGDNQGTADHVGVVESVNGNTITVIEGNKNDSVDRRQLAVNGTYIRGFIVPKF